MCEMGSVWENSTLHPLTGQGEAAHPLCSCRERKFEICPQGKLSELGAEGTYFLAQLQEPRETGSTYLGGHWKLSL